MTQMNGKVVLVSGGTSGIGRAAAHALREQGATVVALSRVQGAAEAAGFEGIVCDLESQASVRAAAKEFLAKHPKLDVLVLSAGVFLKERGDTVDGIEKTFAINYLSQFLLVNLLKDALVKAAPSRVVVVASKYGGAKMNFDDLMLTKTRFSVISSVPRTKLAEVLMVQELAERWKDAKVSANAVHPGLVKHTRLLEEVGGLFKFLTNLLGGSAEKGADTVVWLASSPDAAGITGKLLEKRKPIETPGDGSDPAVRRRLWDESVRLAKL